ncbi:MAG: SpoIIE family protein phosphatase [Acidimicrobiia bacterium]
MTTRHGFPNDEHLALAFDAGRLGLWSWNALTDEITWDDALQARFGLAPTPGTLTFDEYLALVHPEDRELTMSTVAAARDERRDFSFEHRAVWPDGSVHWLEGRGRCVSDEHGEFVGMIGVALDIDDRKRVEEIQREADALRANAELVHQLEDAQRLARIGSWRWVFATDQLELSAEMRRQLGADAPRTGRELIDLLRVRVHADDFPMLQQTQRESVLQGKPYTVEHRLVVKGKTRNIVHRGEIVHDEHGTITGLRGTTQDVTEQRRAEQALLTTRGRLAQEERAVEVLQEALLSAEFPELEHFEMAARYLSAETEVEVGGDWYDAFALPDGRVMLAVGDVSGHGIRAGRLMAKFRYATRAYAILEPDPAAVLVRLDVFASHWGEPEEFATVQLAALDPANGTLELVSAGHPPPLVIGRHDARFVQVEGTRALGLTSRPLDVATNRFTLERGEALLFYTDGLVERRGAALALLGDGADQLAGLTLDETGPSAGEVCDTAIARCLRGISREDDVCVLTVVRCA